MHIIFNHGQESGPFGSKINRLIEVAEAHAHSWTSIDYQDLRHDPDLRVARLMDYLEKIQEPTVLVGSSMGGYVATVAAAWRPVTGLFLMAPALYVGGAYSITEHRPDTPVISVVHGWHDDVIPWKHSLKFAEQNNASLHLLNDDHALGADLDGLAGLFDVFLCKVSPREAPLADTPG